LRLAGERVGVVLHEGKFYAWEDRCTHDDAPMGESTLDGCQIECPRHGARFDVRTGRVTRAPAFNPLEMYSTDVDQDQVYVTLPD
jgi:3-phenylpropionate/trans-cinnamate dioxygenase ferredoxin subunit